MIFIQHILYILEVLPVVSYRQFQGRQMNVHHHLFLSVSFQHNGIPQFLPKMANIQGMILADYSSMMQLVAL